MTRRASRHAPARVRHRQVAVQHASAYRSRHATRRIVEVALPALAALAAPAAPAEATLAEALLALAGAQEAPAVRLLNLPSMVLAPRLLPSSPSTCLRCCWYLPSLRLSPSRCAVSLSNHHPVIYALPWFNACALAFFLHVPFTPVGLFICPLPVPSFSVLRARPHSPLFLQCSRNPIIHLLAAFDRSNCQRTMMHRSDNAKKQRCKEARKQSSKAAADVADRSALGYADQLHQLTDTTKQANVKLHCEFESLLSISLDWNKLFGPSTRSVLSSPSCPMKSRAHGMVARRKPDCVVLLSIRSPQRAVRTWRLSCWRTAVPSPFGIAPSSVSTVTSYICLDQLHPSPDALYL